MLRDRNPAGGSPTELAFPSLFVAADLASARAQRRFLIATRWRLMMLVASASFASFAWSRHNIDIDATAAGIALAIALVTELYLLTTHPDRTWYQARATAESVKTLAWRYVVGGEPFPAATNDRAAEQAMLKRCVDISVNLAGFAPTLPPAEHARQITPRMRETRKLPLAARRELYLRERIEAQLAWYSAKARWNERQAMLWSVTLAVMEALGLILTLLKATELLSVNLAGIAASIITAGVAWLQTRQHYELASAYAVAAQELADIASRIEWPSGDPEWANFVAQAEEAISREHTLWSASHS